MCRSIGARAGFVSADDERRPPTEAALLRLAVKGRDLTVALPKFYVMTIDELPCVFFCGLVVGEHELDCPADTTVLVKDVRSIFRHLRPPCPRHFRA